MKGHFSSGLWQLVLIDDYTAKAVHEGSVHYLRTRVPGDLSAVCQPAAADEWLGPAPWCRASRQLRLCSALRAAFLQCSCLSPVTHMCTHRAMGSFHPGRAGLQIFILYNEWGYQWQLDFCSVLARRLARRSWIFISQCLPACPLAFTCVLLLAVCRLLCSAGEQTPPASI